MSTWQNSPIVCFALMVFLLSGPVNGDRESVSNHTNSDYPLISMNCENESSNARTIDANSVGGMHSGKIFLIQNQNGMGVNTRPASTMTLTADGEIDDPQPVSVETQLKPSPLPTVTDVIQSNTPTVSVETRIEPLSPSSVTQTIESRPLISGGVDFKRRRDQRRTSSAIRESLSNPTASTPVPPPQAPVVAPVEDKESTAGLLSLIKKRLFGLWSASLHFGFGIEKLREKK